jgi:hypothetical protein
MCPAYWSLCAQCSDNDGVSAFDRREAMRLELQAAAGASGPTCHQRMSSAPIHTATRLIY